MLTIPELINSTCQDVRRIEAITAFEELKEKDALFIDVREPGEVANAPVSGSINIPRGVLEMKISEMRQEENKHIYLFCASGARATLAGLQLQTMGFINVTAISSSLEEILQNLSIDH